MCRRGPLVTGHPGQTCPRKGLTYQPVMPPGDSGQWAGMSGLVRTQSLEGMAEKAQPFQRCTSLHAEAGGAHSL